MSKPDPLREIVEEMKRRASDNGCMGAVSLDGLCVHSELPLVDWCDECLMSHLCFLIDQSDQLTALLVSPKVQEQERDTATRVDDGQPQA